ncbi:sodium:solute symporter family protein [Amycolatopsis alkalitolerans]|uniref:Sodium:solute symporter family protein n=2 Tax=Amycolatopsis alkalitolerans TaxID=2547244 RepID=A0A5C4M5T0_9PSEU|nr:sodium:solute symporter family protein [Amycolatopsis alkalitolerans]
MGSLLLWFLLGSEIYTAFTFQGLAGYSYSKGAAGFYNVAQNDVAYAIAFLVLPCIWMLGKKFGYVTQADFIAHRYASKPLGVFVALATALIMIAYIDLNIEGLSAIFRILGDGAISPALGNVLAFVVLACAVFIGGIRGNAIQSVIKDLLMFAAVAALFIAVPLTFFHGFGDMYSSFTQRIPEYFQLPSAPAPKLGPVWLISTVLVTGVGQWMWPQWFGTAFTASSPTALKRQAVLMPFYQIVKVAVLTVGFAAVVALGTGLVGNDVVMHMMREVFPGWVLVLIAIAAMLSAIVPAGPIVMTSASLLSRNVVHALKPDLPARTVFTLTRVLVFPLIGAALVLTLVAPALIVSVLLVAYAFITQLFPAVIVGGIFWKRATKQGVLAGLIVGWGVTAGLMLSHHDPLFGVNAGLVALVANLVVFAAVSVCTKPSPTAEDVGSMLRGIAEESRVTDPAKSRLAPSST